MVWNQYVYEAMNGNEAYNSDNDEIIEQNEPLHINDWELKHQEHLPGSTLASRSGFLSVFFLKQQESLPGSTGCQQVRVPSCSLVPKKNQTKTKL